MKQPLWATNSTLLMLLLICVYIVLFWQPAIPVAASLAPQAIVTRSKELAPINLKTIYEFDIFKTYVSTAELPGEVNQNFEIPPPPSYLEAKNDKAETLAFLEPLPISITGIMVFGEEENNRAIIKDMRTQEERVYQIGDSLEDAQLIRILRNKVIIVRSNSQQETLFLRDQDVTKDLESIEPNWSEFIKPTGDKQYEIQTNQFIDQVKNIGQLIDLLGLITAYKKGISVGVKISNNQTSNLVNALGLQGGDIILSINKVPLASTKGRMDAYKLIAENLVDKIEVNLIRNEAEVSLNYSLRRNDATAKPADQAGTALAVRQHVENNNRQFRNIVHKAKEQDLKNMAQFKNKISQSVSQDGQP